MRHVEPHITRINITSVSNPAVMRDMLPYAELNHGPDLAYTYDDPCEALAALSSGDASAYVLVYQAHVDNTVEIIRYER